MRTPIGEAEAYPEFREQRFFEEASVMTPHTAGCPVDLATSAVGELVRVGPTVNVLTTLISQEAGVVQQWLFILSCATLATA